jgi:hypothetical protein
MNLESITAENLAMHWVGNRQNGEAVQLSESGPILPETLKARMIPFFLNTFREEEFFHFWHEATLSDNPIYTALCTVFEDKSRLQEESKKMALRLFEVSDHQDILPGHFFAVIFSGLMWKDQSVEAVGLFKSEIRESFLRTAYQKKEWLLDEGEGINLKKIDKGCLIYRVNQEEGFWVQVVDHSQRGPVSRYWKERFLGIQARIDSFFQTKSALDLCRKFVTEKLPETFEINKAEQTRLLNKSVHFFKEKETTGLQEFAAEVMQTPEVIDQFNAYAETYENEKDFRFDDQFTVSGSALKKQSRVFKSVIKLDRNFHIYVHGDHRKIVKGYDESSGMHYYQLFFEEEK